MGTKAEFIRDGVARWEAALEAAIKADLSAAVAMSEAVKVGATVGLNEAKVLEAVRKGSRLVIEDLGKRQKGVMDEHGQTRTSTEGEEAAAVTLRRRELSILGESALGVLRGELGAGMAAMEECVRLRGELASAIAQRDRACAVLAEIDAALFGSDGADEGRDDEADQRGDDYASGDGSAAVETARVLRELAGRTQRWLEFVVAVIDHGYGQEEAREFLTGMGYLECDWCEANGVTGPDRWLLPDEVVLERQEGDVQVPVCRDCAESAWADAEFEDDGEGGQG